MSGAVHASESQGFSGLRPWGSLPCPVTALSSALVRRRPRLDEVPDAAFLFCFHCFSPWLPFSPVGFKLDLSSKICVCSGKGCFSLVRAISRVLVTTLPQLPPLVSPSRAGPGLARVQPRLPPSRPLKRFSLQVRWAHSRDARDTTSLRRLTRGPRGSKVNKPASSSHSQPLGTGVLIR